MVPFAYARAASIAAAAASGARHRSDGAHEHGADFFAGGTDMMQLMGEHLRNPGRIVDIYACRASAGSRSCPAACAWARSFA